MRKIREVQLPARDMGYHSLVQQLIDKYGADAILWRVVADFITGGKYAETMRIELEDIYNKGL